MTTLLLFSLPWGYLLAGIFLLLAIILFIVAIFMKDTGENYDEELETRRYKKKDTEDSEASYEDTFDRYQNVADTEESEDTLQDMIAETSENLAETRMFTPIVDIPEPEPFEEPAEVEEVVEAVAEEEVPEEVFTAPIATFADFAEPEEGTEEVTEEVALEAVEETFAEIPADPETQPEEVAEEASVIEPVAEAQVTASADDEDEFEEVRPKKRRFSRAADEEDEMEVPKPVAKQKSGMSFAEEVRRLIEEEERKKR